MCLWRSAELRLCLFLLLSLVLVWLRDGSGFDSVCDYKFRLGLLDIDLINTLYGRAPILSRYAQVERNCI